ncbi:MAG: hypothetical protein ACYC6Z_07945 [Thermoleophilia bacterium]
MVILIIYLITGLLIAVTLIGIYLTVRSLKAAGKAGRAARSTQGRMTLRQRIDRYEGPINRDLALYNAPARVGIEFFTALCGFPGMGWMISGRILAGIILMSTVPIFVWAIFPLYLSMAQPLLPSPFVPVQYLPGVALLSAGSLAVSQFRASRRRPPDLMPEK